MQTFPNVVRIVLREGVTHCLRTSASPSAYLKVIVPIVFMTTGYHFYLDEVLCPESSELAKFKDVFVTYK
ncbi:MAG: hypothetical protein QM750_07910 [Rubrivivax sp.]